MNKNKNKKQKKKHLDRAILFKQNEKFYKKIFTLKNYLQEILFFKFSSIEDNF